MADPAVAALEAVEVVYPSRGRVLGPVDFALIDGWPVNEGRSLAREVIEMIAPQLRIGAYVLNDNGETDFLDFIRDPANGFLSVTLPIKNGTELSVRIA